MIQEIPQQARQQLRPKPKSSGLDVEANLDFHAVAPPGFFIGGAKQDGVLGGAPENFSWTTPSTLTLDLTNALSID